MNPVVREEPKSQRPRSQNPLLGAQVQSGGGGATVG